MDGTDISFRKKAYAIKQIAIYKPKFTAMIILASVGAAALDGIGLSFLIPIIEIVQTEGDPAAEAEGAAEVFVTVYQSLGVPFTLEFVILGVVLTITTRYTSSFIVGWLVSILQIRYTRNLQEQGFDNALNAEVAYFDVEGSDDILNAIVTQAEYAGRAIRRLVRVFELLLLCSVYVMIALYISPVMTILAALILGGLTYLVRHVVEPGYMVGDRVADANEQIQGAAQAGMQGIRDVKLFGLTDYLRRNFSNAVDQFERSKIKLERNTAAIDNFYNLASALTVFVLIYVALRFSDLSLGALAMFLFAMFLLAPRISNLNSEYYGLETDLPHFIRTNEFIEKLKLHTEMENESKSPPNRIQSIAFQDAKFSYPNNEQVLRGISFEIERGDFIAFVGQSGAGKSTIVALLARMYELDSGQITSNSQPIDEFDLEEWREKLAIVRQNPYIFNETLRFNLTIGRQDISQYELDRICEIAQVTEFLENLSDGYETKLGDDGVKLSGGQRQRVALARALIKDAELLILDEATSNLDSDLEQRVHKAIESMEGDYTIIAIAHRLSTVRNANLIYTLENGKVVEKGRHEELIRNDGKYAQLYATQAGGS